MFVLIRNQPAIFCDRCTGQVQNYTEAYAIAINDSLISKTEIIHKDCFHETDQAFLIMDLSDYLIGLLKK